MNSWHATSGLRPPARVANKPGDSPFAVICLQIVDTCFAGTLFVVPLLFGGRHAIGRLVFVSLACSAAVAWFARQALLKQAVWTRTWSYLLGLAAILMVAIQIVPLPAGWLDQVAPRNSSLLPLWTDDSGMPAGLGAWKTLSLTPGPTKTALATLIAYVLLFVTATQRLRTLVDIQRLLRTVAIAVVVMSGFGLLQYFTSNGRFFWFYELPFTTTDNGAKGSFSCRNHFAHFVVLGFGPLLAWTVDQLRCQPQTSQAQNSPGKLVIFVSHACLVLVVFAVLMSLSRGGAVALTVAGGICVLFYCSRAMISSTYLYCLATLGLVVIGMLSLHGYEAVANRLDDFTVGTFDELDSMEGRRKIWATNLAATKAGGLFGAGAGSHREIYPVYLAESLNREYTHAESGALQIATENGYLGIVLLVLALGTLTGWCWKAVRAEAGPHWPPAVAVTASCAASMVHSLVDFVWFIPACMSVTILLAACAFRLAQLAQRKALSTPVRAPWWIGLTATATLASIWAVSQTTGPALASIHWDKYLLAASAKQQLTARLLKLHEPTPEDEQQSRSLTDMMVFHLQQSVERNPQSARTHLRLAGKYLQLFDMRQQHAENAMSIDQIRAAAEASQFASAEELRHWLLQAFGENSNLLYRAYHHTCQALRLCPMQGEGYLYLANLCFLTGQGREAIDAYIAQGMLVRPHDASVLFEAGRQSILLGQSEKAVELWRQIFHDPGIHQVQITRLLAGRFPAALFVETFKPNWQTLPFVWQRYRELGSADDWQYLVSYAANAAEDECSEYGPLRTARAWGALASMQRQLENYEASLTCLCRAYEVAPGDYAVRRELGKAFLMTAQYRQAEPHLRWCLARKPDDDALRRELLQATKQNMTETASVKQNHTLR